MADRVITGRMLLGGAIVRGGIAIESGSIVAVVQGGDPASTLAALPAADDVLRLEDGQVLVPGVVDTHVHINEPGRTAWEGFDHATQAAAAGGVTTVLDMPLNSNPPTLTVDALETKRRAAAGKAHVQVGFWGGVDASNLGTGQLEALWRRGVFGFKCFLSPSGVDEYGSLTYAQVERAMREIASFGGRLICHAEDPDGLAAHAGGIDDSYRSFEATRPASCEADAVRRLADLVARTGCRTHILHVSAGETVDVLRRARADGLPITAETCPHYLTLDRDRIPDGCTAAKCCPPIRGLDDQDRLWQGLTEGTLDIVATDHSPADAAMKSGPLATAWGGVSGLQPGFRAVLTEAMRRGLGLADVVRWMSANTARLAGFHDRGAIAPGRRADLAVLRPDDTWTVDVHSPDWRSRNPISAFDGMTLRGPIDRTIVGGVDVDVDAPAPAGDANLIRRP